MNVEDGAVIYDVAVEPAGIRYEQTGPLFARYAVSLAGPIDYLWVDCYKRLTSESNEYAGFRLDPGTRAVSFTVRSTDGPAQVMRILKKLQTLVEGVNQEATRTAAAPEPRKTQTETDVTHISGIAVRPGFKIR